MKRSKSILFLLVIAAMVFGLVTTAYAAVGSDVVGTKFEVPIKKLAALGIVTGYEDGTIKPDQTITRAEFAAIVVRELNLGTNFAPSNTKFKDVTVSHWAGGYINVAVGKGILRGYPDGTFKPDAPVNYAEAITMLVRMLGYGPAADTTPWPAGYLGKAAEIGVTKGVKGDAYAPAPRGDVFIMAANSLDIDKMKQTKYGSDTIFEELDNVTILTDEFGLTVVEGKKERKKGEETKLSIDGKDLPTVTGCAAVELGTLKKDEIRLSKYGKMKLNPMFNPMDYLGQQVEVWFDDDDDYVYYIAPSSDETVVYDEVKKVYQGKNEIMLDKLDDDYALNDKAKVYVFSKDSDSGFTVSGATYLDDALKKYLGDYYKEETNSEGKIEIVKDTDKSAYTFKNANPVAKVVMDSEDNINALVIYDYDNSDFGVVKEVNADSKYVRYYDGSNSSGSTKLDLDGDDYVLVKDGKVAELKDLAKDDVLNVFGFGTDKEFIVASSAKVKGKVQDTDTTTAKADLDKLGKYAGYKYKVYIDGKKYSLAYGVTYSDDANDSIGNLEVDDVKDLAGVEVTLFLGANGKVRHILSAEEVAGAPAKVAVLQKPVRYLNDADQIKLVVVNESGKEVTWQFDADDVELNGKSKPDRADWFKAFGVDASAAGTAVYSDLTKGVANKLYAIEYKLKSDGSLKSVEVLDLSNKYDKNVDKDKVFDKDDDLVTVAQGTYNVVKSTVIFDVTGSITGTGTTQKLDDIAVKTWDSIKSNDKVTEVAYYTKSNGEDLKYLFILNAGGKLTSDSQYAIIKGFTTKNGDDALKLLTPEGKEIVLVHEDASVSGTVYKYDDPTRQNAYSSKENLKKGLFIRYELDSSGEIDEIEVLAEANYSVNAVFTTTNIDKVYVGTVSDSNSTSIKTNNGNIPVNSKTVYMRVDNTDKLSVVSGVNSGDYVMAFDTDDDGSAADIVVVIYRKN